MTTFDLSAGTSVPSFEVWTSGATGVMREKPGRDAGEPLRTSLGPVVDHGRGEVYEPGLVELRNLVLVRQLVLVLLDRLALRERLAVEELCGLRNGSFGKEMS